LSGVADPDRLEQGSNVRYVLALVVASILVPSAAAQAVPTSEAPVTGASFSEHASSSRGSGARPARTLRSALRSDLKRALAPVRELDLAIVASEGFTLERVRALVAGKASVAVTASRVTVARGTRTFARRGKADVRLKPTRSGTKLLGRASRIALTVKATFAPRKGRRVSARSKVTLTHSVPAPPVPPNARLLYSQTFDSRPPWSGLFIQCAHPVQWASENGDGYAHFEVRPGEPTVAGHERCEVSHGGFGNSRPPGEYWYRARERAGVGFPHAYDPEHWVNIQQWHEDRPAPGQSTGSVDAGLFVNSNSSGTERMLIEGDHLGFSQSGVFDIHAWHDFVVHGLWTDQPNGYFEWWIDGQYVGRMDGVTSETGGRHYWKGGIERSTSLDTLQTSDITSVQVYRAP
jgi:Polysaccharide lyase